MDVDAQFAEYVWMTNQHAVISARLREAWAKKHGLTQEQVEKRAQELIEAIGESAKDGHQGGLSRPGSQPARSGLLGGGTLLQAIQEKLKRVRASKAAAEKAK